MKQVLLGAWLLLQTTTTPPPGINFFSSRQDFEIGTVSAAEAEKQLSIVRDASLNQYIQAIALRLVPAAPRRYRFRIVNSNEVRSLAFPNGTIYIYRGLLSLAANDDEVAAILAHEIGHVVSRHATSQLSRQLLVQAPISISSGFQTDGWKEQLSRLGVVFGVNAPFLHYSPDQETEAAGVATRLLLAGHFSPVGLDSIFQKAGETVTFLYNHPVPDALRRGSYPQKRKSIAFRAFQTSLTKLSKPVADPEDAVSAASDSIPNVYSHPLNYFKLNYPEGWLVTPIMDPSIVALASSTSADRTIGAIISAPNGIVSSASGDDITYGVMAAIFEVTNSSLDKPANLEQATNRLIVSLRQRNQTIRAVPGAQTPMLIHTQPALRTVLLRGGTVRNGNTTVTEPSEVLWLVTRMYYQNLFYMIFVSPEEEFPAHQPIFDQIIRSVKIP